MKDREGNDRKCAAPWCKNEEFRIDGYCSIYCRDMHDERKLTEAAEAKLARCREALREVRKDAGRFTVLDHDYEGYTLVGIAKAAQILVAAALEATKAERRDGGG